MKKHCMLLIPVFFFVSCLRQQEQNRLGTNTLKVAEAKSYIVPKDSLAVPTVIAVDESKLNKIPVGKPIILPASTNRIKVVPKVVLAGTPKVCTPGQDTFLLPIVKAAIDNPFTAGLPTVVTAKDAHVKDRNPGNFRSFSKLQGLTHTHIRCLIQDQIGNIWFGTYGGGITRYDGRSFAHFTENEGLTDNTVFSIAQDQNRNIWFGTYVGAMKYDGSSFSRFTEKEGLTNTEVYSIFQDKIGNIWFGTNGEGIFKYDGKTFTRFTEKEGLSNNIVFTIFQDINENLWFGTEGGGVSMYDGKSFYHFTKTEGLSGNYVHSIIQDRRGAIWFGTTDGGVSEYDGKYFTNLTETEGLSSNHILSILETRDGDLWFATDGKGVSVYNGRIFTHFTDEEGLSSNIIMCSLQDNGGNIWLGTFGGGLVKYNGNIFTHFDQEELGNNKVWGIFQDQDENLWFGTYGGGVTKYDGESFARFTEQQGLSNDRVTSIIQDQNSNIWFGTMGGGVSRFDGNSFTHFTEQEGLGSNNVYCMVKDKSGNLWFGTDMGGATKYDGKSFTHFTEREGLSGNKVVYILQDHKGVLWFATVEGGVTKYDGRSFTHFTEKEGLCSNTVMSILEDQNGNLWFATYNKGVDRYDGRYFVHFTEKEGLGSNTILSMLQDRNGNLWFGTRHGLNKMTPANLLKLSTLVEDPNTVSATDKIFFKSFTYEDGFLGIGCIRNSIYEDKTGIIWTGTSDRLTAYHPEGDEPDTISPNVQLTGIELFNEKIDWTSLKDRKDSILVLSNGASISDFDYEGTTLWYGLPEKLSLAYDNNYLTFNYTGITQRQNNRVKYQHKLEGADRAWSSITTNTQATYSTLPSGKYTFKIKAMNSEGHWSPESHYTFTIRPPWWKTWWFRLMYIVPIIMGIIVRNVYIRKRQKELKTKVNEATADLKKKTEELASANQELEQFAYVASHDLLEPLRTISNYSGLIAEDYAERLDEEGTNYLNVIVTATSRMQSLIKDLLDFSRVGYNITFKEIDCNDIIKDVIDGMRTSIAESNTKISVSGCLPVLAGNETELKRLFQNLISNAIKFRKKNYQHKIEISAKEKDIEYLFAVKDNGIGIPDESKDKIFKIFQRLNLDNEYPGTGIGLATCNKIVAHHHGKIWVESQLGKGSTFYFTVSKKIQIDEHEKNKLHTIDR